jgi:hypothetical protein
MNATQVAHKPLGKRAPGPGGIQLGRDHTPETRRLAAAVLEVLAGARTPTEAAQALGVSVPRYYQVETRALHSLLDGCASKPRGPGRRIDKELTVLRRDQQRLQQEVIRLQSLLRAAQRTVGLTPPAAAPTKKNGKKPRRQRTARALSVAARLQQSTSAAAAVAAVGATQESHQE